MRVISDAQAVLDELTSKLIVFDLATPATLVSEIAAEAIDAHRRTALYGRCLLMTLPSRKSRRSPPFAR